MGTPNPNLRIRLHDAIDSIVTQTAAASTAASVTFADPTSGRIPRGSGLHEDRLVVERLEAVAAALADVNLWIDGL